MAVLSGIGGVVDGHNTIRTWTVTTTADVQSLVASNTKIGTMVLAGNKDWSGSFTGYGHTPAVLPGAGFTFTGTIDGTNGATGTAIVDSVEIVIDIEAGAPISYTVNFSSNGALSLGAAAATDVTTPDPPTSIGCQVETGTMVAVPVWSDITDVRTVTITITADNQSYVSSETAGETLRFAGNISATIAISVYEDDFADLPALNAENGLRVYVTATTYWLFDYVVWGEASDLTVDRESAAVVGATLNAIWTAYGDIDSGTITEGNIDQPSTTAFWPAP